MGWKNVKEHYRIGHIVHVTDEGLCIGSPYINDLIVISLTGRMLKRYDERSNEDLRRYQREMDADPATLRRLIETPDRFTDSITVYTYDDGEIVEKLCEATGWPNVTHDGCLMYVNTFSTDKQKIVARAKANATAGAEMTRRSIADSEHVLQRLKSLLSKHEAALAKLETMYPTE